MLGCLGWLGSWGCRHISSLPAARRRRRRLGLHIESQRLRFLLVLSSTWLERHQLLPALFRKEHACMTPPLLYQAELKAARACRCACLCDADPSPVTFKVFHGTTGGSARPLQVDLQIAEASCVCKLSQCQTRPLGSGRTHCSCQGRLCWTDGTPCLLSKGQPGLDSDVNSCGFHWPVVQGKTEFGCSVPAASTAKSFLRRNAS